MAARGISAALARLARRLNDQTGQSVVELALAAPVLVMALVGGVDLLRVSAIQQAAQSAARLAAEHAALNPDACDSNGGVPAGCNIALRSVQSVVDAELGGTPGFSAANLTVTSLPFTRDGNGRIMGTLSDANATACSASTLSGGVRHLCYVTVEVRYTFSTLFPWWFVPQQVVVMRSNARSMFQ